MIINEEIEYTSELINIMIEWGIPKPYAIVILGSIAIASLITIIGYQKCIEQDDI